MGEGRWGFNLSQPSAVSLHLGGAMLSDLTKSGAPTKRVHWQAPLVELQP